MDAVGNSAKVGVWIQGRTEGTKHASSGPALMVFCPARRNEVIIEGAQRALNLLSGLGFGVRRHAGLVKSWRSIGCELESHPRVRYCSACTFCRSCTVFGLARSLNRQQGKAGNGLKVCTPVPVCNRLM